MIKRHRKTNLESVIPRAGEARRLFEPYLPCAGTELRRVYLRLALRYHPDKWPKHERKAATELFQAISDLYEKLLKPSGQNLVQTVSRSAVVIAAELGDVVELRRLLEENPARANEEGDDFIFPLMSAASSGSVEAMDVLLSYGANLHAETSWGWSALTFAALYDHDEATRWLVSKGLAVKPHVLMLATYTGSVVGLQTLAECYDSSLALVRTDASVWGGAPDRTLLHLACEGMCLLRKKSPESYVASISYLIHSKVPVNAIESRTKRSCLHCFIALGKWREHDFEGSQEHLKVVSLLCEHGADVHLPDINDNTALSQATALGLARVIEAMHEGTSTTKRPMKSCL